MKNAVARWLSWVWPVRVERTQGRQGELTVRWELGRKVLNTPLANQSFGSLHQLWREVFAHVRLKDRPPAEVLMLGLGGGSVVHILRREMKLHMPITAVEHDPQMVRLARAHFGLDAFADVHVVPGDATVQVHALPGRYALVVVDLFNDLDMAFGTDTMGFAHALRERCAEGGTVLFNTIGHSPESAQRCDRIAGNLRRAFLTVDEYSTLDINRVFIAR
ncbi:MAG: fused MFS/spermidine synthase [Flavobacteriales bacterium]|jgi:spermidine synthase|nr:fused MFS/spermidine synthase [Flavobacteriales bacterium]